jgi:hypothetical protein
MDLKGNGNGLIKVLSHFPQRTNLKKKLVSLLNFKPGTFQMEAKVYYCYISLLSNIQVVPTRMQDLML